MAGDIAQEPAAAPRTWPARIYRSGDEHGVLELLQAAFDRWPKVEVAVDPIDHLRWKLTSADEAARHHVVAESEGRIVGLRLFLLQGVLASGTRLQGRQEVDACVHPDFQRQGITTAISRDLPEELRAPRDVYLCLGSGHPAWKRIEWRNWDPITLTMDALVCETPPRRHPRGDNEGLSITQPERFDERIDAFAREAAKPYDFIIERTRRYLDWRYCDPRAGRFALRPAEDGDRLVGYSVLRLSRGIGYIADLLALSGREDVARALIDDALAWFGGEDIRRTECWLPANHPYVGALREAGFLQKRREVLVRCQPSQEHAEKFRALAEPAGAAVHLTAGDTDLV